ncbi:MAG TPA: molybdopterin-dependent oxidoreductase [Noviherbaspirillum sp.]|uniref:molybdopterin-dependent oxidoreductase n=1 Tax=Noviherbaspirillum sp. TaxID=1926288 RepID=UPI002B46F737|nr:molybdopterin-dependent oxidoreductase [Noviherbaspirillum sp.]HJV86121.1 molybdopterin-dependent oxidoreductase [Noviherbaspirillum sp.]
MNKREFLAAALASGTLPSLAHAATSATPLHGPTLLTVTGAIGKGNRGALDPALDQMMKKQGVQFDRAQAFDYAALTTLPAVDIRPTLEYDAKPHALRGPLLTEVLKASGAAIGDGTKLVLRAIDGYAVSLPLADARERRFIVATHLDGKPMPLGGLGPLWAVYDADRFPDMAAKPVNERFGLCPWGLYHIDVR